MEVSSTTLWRALQRWGFEFGGIGLQPKLHEFNPSYDISNEGGCQLIPGTSDGFPALEVQLHHHMMGPDPPSQESYCDPPFPLNYYDPPHCEEYIDPPQ
jgi:hypothetical protein